MNGIKVDGTTGIPTCGTLEALALMNETLFVEASRKLAERILSSGGQTDKRRVAWGFRAATGRRPTEREQNILLESLQEQRTLYQADIESARQLLAVGESTWHTEWDARELAAWTIVASTILNLDEAITKN